MTGVSTRLVGFGLSWALIAGCARAAIEPVERPPQDIVVLLPDAPDGAVGRASVEASGQAVTLGEARAATRVSSGRAPSAVEVLSEAEVQAALGGALESLPPAPQTFTMYFEFESETLTAESRTLLADTMQAVKRRPAPDVLVVGHTDTTGSPASNFELGLRRAMAVRVMLIGAGLDERAITVTSHGESQLLVITPDGTREPRNRRVQITVR
jgi:outer membrane protein OmpA-like peptidoglycan-associated protein